MTLVHRYLMNHTSSMPKRVKVEVPLSVDIPLESSADWRVLDGDTRPATEQIQEMLRNLQHIRINTRMFSRQLVAM